MKIKRIVSFILIIIMSAAVMTGCSMFEKNTGDDMAQIVAVIEPREFTANGTTYMSERKEITKQELLTTFNNNYQNYMQQGYEVTELLDFFLGQLIDRELLLLEADRLAREKLIEKVTITQENAIWKKIYSAIDSQLYNLTVEIANEYDLDVPPAPQTGTASEPKYAVKIVEDADEIVDTEVWVPTAPEATDALKLEAINRFCNDLFETIGEIKLSSADIEKVNADKELVKNYVTKPRNERVELYYKLKDMFTIRYFYYRTEEQTAIIQNLEKYAKKDVTVSEAEIQEYYDTKLKEQKIAFADLQTYIAALAGKDPVLYHSDAKQFYVKHILIPFSDKQSAALQAYKTSGKNSPAQIKTYREQLAYDITGYAHLDGYDTGKELTIQTISNEIYGTMKQYEGNSYMAETKFENLIFKYNTDSGIFNNKLGYGMQYGTATSYVPEFEKAMIKLYEDYQEGDAQLGTLSDWVVTDFGVHIMMLSSFVEPGVRYLNDYTDVFKDKTYYELIKKTLKTSKEEKAFSSYATGLLENLKRQWSNQIIKYESRYADIQKQLEQS